MEGRDKIEIKFVFMLQIPINIFEQHLTDWFSQQFRSDETSDEDKKAAQFLLRLSKAQMVERNRGDEYPFIEEMQILPDEFDLIEQNKWLESENIEVKAYCLDVYARQQKDKREIKRRASDAYLELYKRVKTPWYLVRSVIVRYYQKGFDQEFLKEMVRLCPHIHGSWLKYVSEKLARDCKDDIDGYASSLENMIISLENKHSWHDAVDVFDALYALKKMSREQYHLKRALLLERHFDYRVATQTETTYNMKVDIIQEAHKEISKIKDNYPEQYEQIRNKMIDEQKEFAEKLQIFGVKSTDKIPQELVEIVEKNLQKEPMDSAVKLICAVRSIKFPTPGNVNKLCKALVKSAPMLYISFGSSVALGENGQTIGKADTEESLKITAHKRLRNRIRYTVKCLIVDYLKRGLQLNEDSLGTRLMKACNASYIEESRKVLWAKGIAEGCKGDMITASHILMPQIERALVLKAQLYCGDLTNYEREHHDQITLERALTALKPHLKSVLYDELRFFLNHGADANFRNQIAHGLMDPEIILEQGIYLWWLAIKMVFCEKEIFTKKRNRS